MKAMGPRQAAALVQARLGRAPQDALEATVVLEAWCGVRSPTALSLGEQLVGVAEGGESRSIHGKPDTTERWRLSEQLALVVALVALLAWSAPLISAVGSDAFETTWKLAVPLTLAAQWGLRRRYLVGAEGLGRLRGGAAPLFVAAVALPVVLALLFGVGGALGGLLVVIWVTAMIAGRRGWGLWYAALLVGTAVALWEGMPALPMMIGAAAGGAALVALALVRTPIAGARPAVWPRVLVAATLGGALGLMLVVDGSVQWGTDGPLPALILLPSVLGGLWGSAHLGRLWTALPKALRTASVDLDVVSDERASRHAASVIGGAVARQVTVTVVLSLVVLTGPWAAGVSPRLLVWLLAGFGVVALGTLVVTLNDAFARPGWALAAVLTGLAAEVALRLGIPDAQVGVGLLIGGFVALTVLVPPTLALIREPARTLATIVNVR